MKYTIILVDDEIKEHYDTDEIIFSFYGLHEIDETTAEKIDAVIYTHPDAKFYFENLNDVMELQADALWPDVEILRG